MNERNLQRDLHSLVGLMRTAGDDGSHTHQPSSRRVVGQPDGTVSVDGKIRDAWKLDAQPCAHRGCRCLLRWLPNRRQHAWRAVATSR